MKDLRVDELLDDLDRALNLQASPTVAANVRAGMARETDRRLFGLRWYLAAAVAAAGIVMMVAYLAVFRTSPVEPTAGTTAATPSPERSEPIAPWRGLAPTQSPERVPQRVQVSNPLRRSTRAQGLDMTPLISPASEVALGQLSRALERGVIVEFAPPVLIQPAEVVIPVPIAIEPITIETTPLSDNKEFGRGSGR